MKVFGITSDILSYCRGQRRDEIALVCGSLLSKFDLDKTYEAVVIPPYNHHAINTQREYKNVKIRMLPKGTNIKEGTLKKNGEGFTTFARLRRFAGFDGGKARDQVSYLSAGDRVIMMDYDTDHNVLSAAAKFIELREKAAENRETLRQLLDEQARYKPDDVRFTTLAKKIEVLKEAVDDTKIDSSFFMLKLKLDPYKWLFENTKIVSVLMLNNVNIIVAEVLDNKKKCYGGFNNIVKNWFDKIELYLLEWNKFNHDNSVKELNRVREKLIGLASKAESNLGSSALETELNIKAIEAILQADKKGDSIALSYIDVFAKYLDSLDVVSKAYDLESNAYHNAINEAYVMDFEPCTTFPKSDDVVINRFDSVQPLSPIDPQKLAATISSGLIRSKDKDMGIGKDNIVLEDGTLLRFSMMQKETVSQSTLTDSNQKTVTVREVFIEHVPTCCVFDPFIKEVNILRI